MGLADEVCAGIIGELQKTGFLGVVGTMVTYPQSSVA